MLLNVFITHCFLWNTTFMVTDVLWKFITTQQIFVWRYNAKCHSTVGQEIVISCTDWSKNAASYPAGYLTAFSTAFQTALESTDRSVAMQPPPASLSEFYFGTNLCLVAVRCVYFIFNYNKTFIPYLENYGW